ncbi:MAG: hypothetical protein H0U73_03595 [Tatlockia sp.]|nr:hypothetical protein [Tatlockia sp.]
MSPEALELLIKAYLSHKFPTRYQDSWLISADYKDLATAIEYIDRLGPNSLNLEDLRPPQDLKLFYLLDRTFKFSESSPPQPTAYDERALYNILIDLDKVSLLPDGNYTQRQTTIEAAGIQLLQTAKMKLLDLSRTQLPNTKLITKADLKNAISNHEKIIAENSNSSQKNQLENELNLLKDLRKLVNLKDNINIPKENGEPNHFLILDEAAGGVTEKISLISLDDASQKISNICNIDKLNFNSYCANRNDYKLSTEAILKLPKHGNTTEVQREAIALNISRILGFNTTKSSMIDYKGQAALFVPFDEIKLLNEFAKGKDQILLLPSAISGLSKFMSKYLHYSTINPVGNELNSDQILEDFGKMLAFSYLCNDPDFIGMDNQNKAIKSGKELYVFDQVIMAGDDKMELDSRMSLSPVGSGRHSRHNQGRNRSVIEDSSFDAKFNSIATLLDHKGEINVMLDTLYLTHKSKLIGIKNEYSTIKTEIPSQENISKLKHLEEQFKEVGLLHKDVLEIKRTTNTRMKSMLQKFPRINGSPMNSQLFLENKDLIKPCLVLEKLVNKPVLFSADGRPYKHPWTHRNNDKISTILQQNEKTFISFDSDKLNLFGYSINAAEMTSILVQLGIDNFSIHENTLIIPNEELSKINENSLFPEHRPFDSEKDYLAVENLAHTFSAYSPENQTVLIESIKNYKADMQKTNDPAFRIKVIENAQNYIDSKLQRMENKGLLKHFELNMQMDFQAHLRQIILINSPELSDKIAQAFEAAVKVDRVKQFNSTLIAYVKNPTGQLANYLDKCIDHANKAQDYGKAKTESEAMAQDSLAFTKELSIKQDSPLVAMRGLGAEIKKSISLDDWNDDNVLEIQQQRKEELKAEFEKISEKKPEAEEPSTEEEPRVKNPGIKTF